MESESHISRKEKHELPKIPRELIERLTNVTDLYLHFRSEIRKAYLDRFLYLTLQVGSELLHIDDLSKALCSSHEIDLKSM